MENTKIEEFFDSIKFSIKFFDFYLFDLISCIEEFELLLTLFFCK